MRACMCVYWCCTFSLMLSFESGPAITALVLVSKRMEPGCSENNIHI